MVFIFEVIVFRNTLEVYALKAKELSGSSLKSGGCHVKTRLGQLSEVFFVASVFHTLSKDIALSEPRIQTAIWSNLHHGSHAGSKPEEPGQDLYALWCHYLCWKQDLPSLLHEVVSQRLAFSQQKFNPLKNKAKKLNQFFCM